MKFTKMHGNANDYIYVNCFEDVVTEADAPALSRAVSDRHKGVGSDGLVLIRPSERFDCRMDMYNADGSRGRMCGNAIRCVGKYVFDRGIIRKPYITVETLSGIKTLDIKEEGGVCVSVTVNMGPPDFNPGIIPVSSESPFINQPLTAGGVTFHATCVNTGSSHAVIYVEDIERVDVRTFGPLIENHELFPDRINVNFAQILSDNVIKSRTWERGSGETMACGSGASACLAVSAYLGKTGREAQVVQLGGQLTIKWDEPSGDLFMTGPAAFVCDGVWPS